MEKKNTAEELFHFNLLQTLSEDEANLLASRARELKINRNDSIYRLGTSADRIYIVKTGRVKICTDGIDGKEVMKSLVHSGELFGEGAIFGEDRRRDYACAMDEGVVVLELMASDVRKIMKNHPEFSFKITTQIAQKLRNAEKRLEALTFKNSRTRIIEFLRDTARKQGRKIGFETLLHPFLTHQDIGNLTTTSRQTVSSVLNELKGSNKIYYDRQRLLIRDLNVLA